MATRRMRRRAGVVAPAPARVRTTNSTRDAGRVHGWCVPAGHEYTTNRPPARCSHDDVVRGRERDGIASNSPEICSRARRPSRHRSLHFVLLKQIQPHPTSGRQVKESRRRQSSPGRKPVRAPSLRSRNGSTSKQAGGRVSLGRVVMASCSSHAYFYKSD